MSIGRSQAVRLAPPPPPPTPLTLLSIAIPPTYHRWLGASVLSYFSWPWVRETLDWSLSTTVTRAVRGVLEATDGLIEVLSLALHIRVPFIASPFMCGIVRFILRLVHVLRVGVGLRVMVVVVVVKEMRVIARQGVGGVWGVVVGVGVAARVASHAADTGVGAVSVRLTLPTGWSVTECILCWHTDS